MDLKSLNLKFRGSRNQRIIDCQKSLKQGEAILLADLMLEDDNQTIKKIDSKVKNYIVPLGVDSYLLSYGVNKEKIHTLKWWESITINDIDYTLTPSRH